MREDRVIVNAPEKDQEAPKASSTELKVSGVKSSGFTISWEKATDNVTDPARIVYKVYLTNFDDPEDDYHLMEELRGCSSYVFSKLKENTKYGFFVEAVDEAGNVLTYPVENGVMQQVTNKGVYRPTQSNTVSRPGARDARPADLRLSQSITDYLNSVKNKDQLKPIDVTKDRKPAQEFIVMNGQAMQLVNVEKDFTKSFSEFMPIDAEKLFPGQVVYVDENLANGKPVVVFEKDDEVGTVTVSTNFISGDGKPLTKTDVLATRENITNARSEILHRGISSGALPPVDARTNSSMSNSKEKVAIEAGCSVEFLGTKCEVETSTSRGQESFYQMESFTQGFYTISVSPKDNDRANYLGKKVTPDILKNTYEYTRKDERGRPIEKVFVPLGVITSVTYGRMGFNVKTYEVSSFAFNGKESLGYKKAASIVTKQDIEESSATAHHYARIWGGCPTAAGKALGKGVSVSSKEESKKLDEDFTAGMTSNMEVGPKSQGVPIFYTVEYLASGEKVDTKMTANYVESEYIPLVNTLSLEMEMEASVLGGTECIVVYVLYDIIKLDSAGNIVDTSFGQSKHKWSNKATKFKTITLEKDCYFKDNEIKLVIKSCRAAGQDWVECNAGIMDITGGDVHIKFIGSFYNHTVRPGGRTEDGYTRFKK